MYVFKFAAFAQFSTSRTKLIKRSRGDGHAGVPAVRLEDLRREIKESAHQISLWTGKPVDAFAWAYSWDGIDHEAWEVVKQTHRFCFSPCPGTVDPMKDSPLLIWRKEIECYYSPAEYRFMYSGLVDLFWATKRKNLRNLLASADDHSR